MKKNVCTIIMVLVCCIVCGCDQGKTTPAPGGETPKTTATGGGELGGSSEMVKVSLSVPHMTWGGCAASVRSDLEKIETVTDIETDTSKQVCSFRVSPKVDYKSKLDEFAKTNAKLKDYEVQ